MNIFILDHNPKQAAQWLCDKHMPKMALESAQLLCYPIEKQGTLVPPYKTLPKTYHKHPCVTWLFKSKANYDWLCEHALEICLEYTARYNKLHKCQEVIEWCINNKPTLPNIGLTPFALAIKKETYQHLIVEGDAVQTYRNYYIADKARFAKWKRNKPDWFIV
jgi:hypothetical protein